MKIFLMLLFVTPLSFEASAGYLILKKPEYNPYNGLVVRKGLLDEVKSVAELPKAFSSNVEYGFTLVGRSGKEYYFEYPRVSSGKTLAAEEKKNIQSAGLNVDVSGIKAVVEGLYESAPSYRRWIGSWPLVAPKLIDANTVYTQYNLVKKI